MAVVMYSVAAVCALLAPAVEAHGWLQKPLARQLCNGDKVKWSMSQSGGHGACGMTPPYGGVPGLCGDPFGSKDCIPGRFEKKAMACEPQETYQRGGIMRTHVDISANHGGFWELSICDSTEISQKCFDKHKLKTVEHGVEQWHVMDRKIDNPSSDNPDSYVMEWQLPPDLVCDHCVVQWTWWTAHNCLYPCEKKVCGFYADRQNKVVYPNETWKIKECQTRWPAKGQQPQMYKNCADIRIEGNGSGATTRVRTESTPEAPEDLAKPEAVARTEPTSPSSSNLMARWMTSRFGDGARRMLMNVGVLKQDDDPMTDIGGAGNAMACSDHKVTQVLLELNKLREEADAPALECNNRAVGTAENFAEIMCDQAELIYQSADNCHLSGSAFAERCLQVVADGDSDTPLTSISVSDLEALQDPAYTVGAAGHYSCNGRTYWTILLG